MPKTPAYRTRKGYDQALVTLTDSRTGKRRDYWLGAHGTPASRERYHRLVAEWIPRRSSWHSGMNSLRRAISRTSFDGLLLRASPFENPYDDLLRPPGAEPECGEVGRETVDWHFGGHERRQALA